VDALWDVLEEGLCQFCVGGEFLEINRNQNFLSLCVNITDIDTAFVREKDPVTLEMFSGGNSGLNGEYSHL
jgi:hypothetical protein